MPRLFIGLEIPDDVADKLSALRGGIAGARWSDPDDYHVTLRFIGDIEPRLADDLVDALEGVRAKPLRVEFDGLGAFGGDKPHTVVARVRANDALSDLQGELERRVRRLGLAPEPRKFTPHVTLARLRRATPHDVAAYLTIRPALALPAFVADRVALFSARESVGGGPYHLETTFALA
jgi:RNA 2',3'-cyclic 3'-phosphodiesterase